MRYNTIAKTAPLALPAELQAHILFDETASLKIIFIIATRRTFVKCEV